jgi:hypothetical protein
MLFLSNETSVLMKLILFPKAKAPFTDAIDAGQPHVVWPLGSGVLK